MLLYDVAAALQEAGVPFAIAGGFAVALHGAVRGTVDLDIVLRFRERDFQAAEKALGALGLRSRLPVSASEVFKFREEYIKNRSLVAWSFAHPADPTRLVDIILTHDLSKLHVKTMRTGRHALPVLALADLVAMKEASGRAQDLEDVRALKELHP